MSTIHCLCFQGTLKSPSYLTAPPTRGIGQYTAEQLARQKQVVLVHGRSAEKVKRVVQRLEKVRLKDSFANVGLGGGFFASVVIFGKF